MIDHSDNTRTPALLKKSRVIHQTSQGPTVDDVAAQLLRKALKAQYPERDLDPDHTLIGTPQWQLRDGTLVAMPTQFESLTQALARQFFTAASANYLEGEHFLTLNPTATPVVHLDIGIESIAELLNDYAPLLFVEFAERQLAYWNDTGSRGPRWQDLSSGLRKTLDVQRVDGWDVDQCHVARAVSLYPDRQERQAYNPMLSQIQVSLIDIDTVDAHGNASHLLLGGAAVLTGRYRQRDLVMMYTVEGGYESFDSLDKLGASLPARIGRQLAGRDMRWQLFEPDGNFFDHMAWALIASELDTIAAISRDAASAETDDRTEPPFLPNQVSAQETNALTSLDGSIPDWLFGASAADLDAYSESVNALGTLYKQPHKDLSRILPITTFAQNRMREAIIADKKTAASLPLDDIEITITNSFESGGLTLPNPLDAHTETLGEYALQNAAPFQATVRFKQAHPVPDWLTDTYLTDMANRVNIGLVYPRLIQDKLIDDAAQARLQEHFYISQLHALLPLIALECKIRRLGGVDEQGYRCVREWLTPTPDHPRPVVIRPLTFAHSGNAKGDTVANMFIIGPRQSGTGPCLLYRPLLEQPLLQFPTTQNLLYALHQPGELRDSVLAWLPDAATSFKYAQYTFPVGLPSPWLAAQLLAEPWTPADWGGPVRLSSRELTGDVFALLFKSHAQTMAELADRQSLSNAQRRWALLRDSGWALFNIAANFLSGPAGAAIWVWQSISEIDQVIEAHKRGDALAQWSTVADMLLNLGMILAHHAATRRKTGPRTLPRDGAVKRPHVDLAPAAHPAPPTVTRVPTPLTGELPTGHYSSLEASGSVPHRSPTALTRYLESLEAPTLDLAAPALETLLRDLAPLYRLNERTYAQVGGRWFRVMENEDRQVRIVHPGNPLKTGPLLIHNKQGQWFVDTRLRLCAGAGGISLKNQLKARRREKEQAKKNLGDALEAFKRQEPDGKAALKQAQIEMMGATGPAHDQATQRYLSQVETLIGDYDQALNNLVQWRLKGGSTGYLADLLRLTTELQKNLCLWFVLKRSAYEQITQTLARDNEIDLLESRQTHLQSVRQALSLSQDLIARLQLSQTSLLYLDAVGSPGMVVAQRLRKLLPAFTQWELKSNEIGMSHELCMREEANDDTDPAREAVGSLIVETATASHRHIAQMRPQGNTPVAQHIDNLSALIDVYADADQRLRDFPVDYPDKVVPAELERVRGLILEFRQLAQEQLSTLLTSNLEPAIAQAPAPAIAGPSRRPGKVTKSRPRQPAASSAREPEEQPLEEILPARARPPAAPTLDDTGIIFRGLELNDDVQGFITRTRKDAGKPNRIPADMQDLFDQQARRLEKAAIDTDQALARIRAAGQTPPPVANLSNELNSAASRLRAQGISTRASLLKERQPRQAYLQWLLDHQQVRIVKNEQGRIRTKKRRDFFQEYRILDATEHDQPLWLAHFHYDTVDAPLEDFTAAHLKIADEHLESFTAERRKELTTLTPIDYVLRRIADTAPFFTLQAQS